MATLDQVAQALNLTTRRVTQLVHEGLPRGDRGEYEIGPCMHWYIRYLQKAVQARVDPEDQAGVREWTYERGRLAREQADRTALMNAEVRGDLGRFSVWQEDLIRFLGEIRAAMLVMPTKLAPVLDGDVNSRRDTLQRAVQEILARVAAYRPKRRTRDSAANDSPGGAGAKAAAAVNGKPMVGRASPAKPGKLGRTRTVAH